MALLDAEMVQLKDAWAKLIRTTSGADRTLLSREKADFDTVYGYSEMLSPIVIYRR